MKGFTQIYRIDYQENFTLIAKMNAIRILLSCTALLDQDLQQFDIKNVFLHGGLGEVYMEIHPGCDDDKNQGKGLHIE